MIEIDLKMYAPCLNDTRIAEDIYNNVINNNPLENEIVLDMEGVISLSVPCINILFWGLYNYMGADKFHENLVLKGCSEILGNFITFILNERKKREDGSEEN